MDSKKFPNGWIFWLYNELHPFTPFFYSQTSNQKLEDRLPVYQIPKYQVVKLYGY